MDTEAPGEDGALRIVVVDDHPIVREGLQALFDTVPDIDVVAEAADAATALREVTLTRPDVVLLDVHLPGPSGLEVMISLRRASPRTRIVLLTMDDDADTVVTAVRLGADGYLVKGARQAEILRAVRAVHDGQMILGPGLDRHVRALTAPAAAPFPQLTSRERQILDLLAGGLSTATIADRLKLAPKTVANSLTSVFTKLAVRDRTHAVIVAREAGLGRNTT